MTGETHIVATPPIAATLARDAASKSATPPPPSVDAKPAAPATGPTQTPPPSFPVTLQFDQETHRFFIEARDASGLVVLRLPFKSAAPVTAGTTSSSTRGQRVNSKA